MWFIRKPSEPIIRAFLERQQRLEFSYPEVGSSRHDRPAGYDNDHNRILLGKGPVVYEVACAVIRRWQMFPAPWTAIVPPNIPIKEGQAVGILFRVLGLWWLIASRIVYVLEESNPVRRFGFAYGTLPDHIERGEERFSVEWLADDTVWYDLRAFSRPQYWAVRLGYPLARRFQRRFVRESQAAMQRIVTGTLARREVSP